MRRAPQQSENRGIEVPDLSAAERGLALGVELFELAEEIMRQNVRRAFPEASGDEIERRLSDWYLDSSHQYPPGSFLRKRARAVR